ALALLGVATVVHRAVAVPAEPGADAVFAAVSRPPSPEAFETADLYRAAFAELKPFETFAPGYAPPDPAAEAKRKAWDEAKEAAWAAARAAGVVPENLRVVGVDTDDYWLDLSDQEERFVLANQEVVALTLAASRRPSCAFADRSTVDFGTLLGGVQELRDLARLVAADARRLQRADDLVGAADRYKALLRMSRHVAEGGVSIQLLVGQSFQSMALGELFDWAWHERQTPELLHAMIVELEASDGLIDMYLAAVETEWLSQRRSLGQVDDFDWTKNGAVLLSAYRRLAPWEEVRWRRLIDQRYFHFFNRTAAAFLRLRLAEEGTPLEPSPAPAGAAPTADELERWLRSTSYVRMVEPRFDLFERTVKNGLTTWRLTTVLLACREYQLRHAGRLPETLEDMVGRELARLPIDPWSVDVAAPVLYPPAGLPEETRFFLPGDSPYYTPFDPRVPL
ncbi:MAG: hypothetical protein ACRDD1_11530, partial [Planctomycetia bacterium]